MRFGIALPWWALVLVAAAVCAVAWATYARTIVPLTPGRRAALVVIRTLALALLVACLLRPVRVMPPDSSDAAVVPVLVDVSRSMRLADPSGQSRIEAARRLAYSRVAPALEGRFHPEIWTFGDELVHRPSPSGPVAGGSMSADALTANDARSDLSGALRDIHTRYQGRRIAGIVVISDGGDTGSHDVAVPAEEGAIPVHTIGVGSPEIRSDLEVLDLSAGEATLADSSVDLTVSAVNRGSGAPFDLRVLENGRPIDVRRVKPNAAGSPVRTVVTVSPPPETATLYTIEIPAAPGELVLENNRRSVVVEPPARKRKILVIEGAPGFEHSFVKRALAADPGIELDSVVRKGRDSGGNSTYFVQAAADRASVLATGFPERRSALYGYDGIVLANVEPDALSGAQFGTLAEFVAERGGGLLVLGAKSLAQRGLSGTALEEVLPVALSGRDTDVVRTTSRDDQFTVTVTADGETHPVMRIGTSAEDTAKRWGAVPPLTGASPIGAARPGARVLAMVRTSDGQRPLVAVQRYGHGRSMVFAGEASWRWRMHMASNDRTFELFWRQAVRWIASGTPDRVAIAQPSETTPGDVASIGVDVRDDEFRPVADAQVTMRVSLPGGATRELRPSLADARAGRYAGDLRLEQAGVYHISAEARRGDTSLGSADRWIVAGGVDRELADPRLNEDVLRRISRASGGSYLAAGDISRLPSLIDAAGALPPAPRVEELWHTGWIFAAVIMLLSAEWIVRRSWGLR